MKVFPRARLRAGQGAMKNLGIVGLWVVCAGGLVALFASLPIGPAPALSAPAAAKTPKPVSATPAKAAASKALDLSLWDYSEQTDQMRGSVTRRADLRSRDAIDLGQPYGVVHVELILQRTGDEPIRAYLHVRGQFACNYADDDKISVKFDDGPVEDIKCSELADGSPGYLAIEDAPDFVEKLRASSRLIIEAQYYENGLRQVRFNVSGLKW